MVTWHVIEQNSLDYQKAKNSADYIEQLIELYEKVKTFCYTALADYSYIRYELARYMDQYTHDAYNEWIYPPQILNAVKGLTWDQLVNPKHIGFNIALIDVIIHQYRYYIRMNPDHKAKIKTDLIDELQHHTSYFPTYHFSVYETFTSKHLSLLAKTHPILNTFQIKEKYEY